MVAWGNSRRLAPFPSSRAERSDRGFLIALDRFVAALLATTLREFRGGLCARANRASCFQAGSRAPIRSAAFFVAARYGLRQPRRLRRRPRRPLMPDHPFAHRGRRLAAYGAELAAAIREMRALDRARLAAAALGPPECLAQARIHQVEAWRGDLPLAWRLAEWAGAGALGLGDRGPGVERPAIPQS